MPMSRKNDGSFLMLNINRPAFGPLEEIHLSGAKSSLIDKDMVSVKLPSTDAFASAGKGVRRKRVIPKIPDLNIALSDLPDAEDVMGNLDPSTTGTKCLETTLLHAVQPSSTSRRIKRRKMSASGSISFGTNSLNSGDSHPQEIVNRSFRKFREGGPIRSELTFARKEVIVLDSDDDADYGPASVTIGGSSSKELIELEKNIASEKNGKSPSAQGMEKTEEITHIWSLYPPTVRRTAQENPEPTVVHSPQISYVALEPIRGGEVSSTVALDVLTSVSNKQQIEIVNRSVRKFREGGPKKSELTFAGKEVIVLDLDDDADYGPASVTISGSSSKELIELEKNIASDKNGKSPSAQGMEITEEITCIWPLYPPTVRRTAPGKP